ncbi:MAG: VWA domain-containing protein [Verrucomicrobia bacterium]|nr:VWA domain-containing protein [Verrucomicrobiota bacterium]
MNFAVRFHTHIDAFHKTLAHIPKEYSKTMTFLAAQGPLLKQLSLRALKAGGNFVWSHRQLFVFGAVCALAMLIADYIRKRRPLYPTVTLQSSLTTAQVEIAIPGAKLDPPNVTLTFCIDLSGSMNDEGRLDQVKEGIIAVLKDAQSVVNHNPQTKISYSIVGFTDTAKTIASSTTILQNEKKTDETISQIQQLSPNGNTDILAGLTEATKMLTVFASKDSKASHTIVLLTDGDSNINDRLSAIHSTIATHHATLFGIGIGAGHKEETLQKIVTSAEFKGEYIATTQKGVTIENSIRKIYEQAIASFSNLKFTCSQLKDGEWSLDRSSNGSVPALPSGHTLKTKIKIHEERLTKSLDLKKVVFRLDFTDIHGKQGYVDLPWKPNSIVDPQLIKG